MWLTLDFAWVRYVGVDCGFGVCLGWFSEESLVACFGLRLEFVVLVVLRLGGLFDFVFGW